MIKLKNLSYRVFEGESEKVILNNLSLSFPKGKITCITGQNGSGKSTLIKILMGILKQTNGQVLFENENIDELSVTERAKLGISLAFQQPVRFKGLTVRDIITLAIKNSAPDKEVTLAEICKYLSMVGLCAKDYVDRQLDDTLSGGELKRIELAVAVAKGGEVFLFDEPEAGIDLWSFDGLIDMFKSLKNKTVIIVSHQKKILDVADYILLLNENNEYSFGKRNDVLVDLKKPQCGKLGGVING